MKLLIADDHVIIRRGLKFLLDTHFSNFEIFETETCKGILEMVKTNEISHLILDMQLQDGNVMEILSNLRSHLPDVFILIYTMSPEEIFAKPVLRLGANGFLKKQSPESEVLIALELFLDGKNYVSPELQMLRNADLKMKSADSNPFKQLSDRELEVLNYLLKGLSIKEIGLQLNVKSNTVTTFKARLFDKLGVSNIIDLQNMANLYNFEIAG